MVFGRAEEDRPTPSEVYNWRLYGIAFLTYIAAWCFGYSNGVIGGCIVLPSFHRDFRLPHEDTSEYKNIVSNIVSFTQLGGLAGSLLVFPIVKTYGRKLALAVGGALYFAGAAMQTFPHGSLGAFYAGRSIAGVALGFTTMVVSMYLAELSPPAIRGTIVGFAEITNQIASIFGYWSIYFVQITVPATQSKQWQIPLAMQLIPGGLVFIAAIFILPESPRFLIEKGRSNKAREVLTFLRNLPYDHEYINFEIYEVEEAIETLRDSPDGLSFVQLSKELLWKGNRNRLALGIFLGWAANFTGVNGVNFYTPSIFQSFGFHGRAFLFMVSGFYAISKGVGTVATLLFFVDKAGRKTLLMTASVGVILSMFYMGTFITATDGGHGIPASKSLGGWVAVACVMLFAFSFSTAWNGVPWIFCAEAFPARVKELGISITTASQWLAQFTMSRIMPYLLSSRFGGLFYFFFGTTSIICMALVWFLLPETKDVTLERMDEIFGSPYEEDE